MLAKTGLVVCMVLAPLISALAASSPTPTAISLEGHPTHAITDFENPFSEVNRVHFNLTTYLAQSRTDVAEIEKRGQPGMYFCRYPNWGWPCWWQPAVWQCVNTPQSAQWSLGPDVGVFCNGYANFDCPSNWRRMTAMHHPGDGNLLGMRSYRCSTQEFWW